MGQLTDPVASLLSRRRSNVRADRRGSAISGAHFCACDKPLRAGEHVHGLRADHRGHKAVREPPTGQRDAVAAGQLTTDAHWRKLTSALSMPEFNDDGLKTLRGRKKQRDRVEQAVRGAISAVTYDEAVGKLDAHGPGFTEVIPLERVLEAPQAKHPGKVRNVAWRGMRFEVPGFPGEREESDIGDPPELGQDSGKLLAELGYSAADRDAILRSGAVCPLTEGTFKYAPVSRKP